ncbi:hypothetical protein GV819_19195 [Pseudomonas sp. Fl5BN2]|uniref:hypothetical protein n=1 Tax=Pseudomonas sp. Fl5BN2 TaxID=2697652 RepID=UPI0013778382|nr:hypothetical protein [Pseudomonas sp. Fl5BN2]NBF04412.1 hypothetical protein [Pseudomonas sp. Fl5BN2]
MFHLISFFKWLKGGKSQNSFHLKRLTSYAITLGETDPPAFTASLLILLTSNTTTNFNDKSEPGLSAAATIPKRRLI